MGTKEANKKYNQKKKEERIKKTFILNKDEIWVVVKNYPIYRITNMGRVYSTKFCKFLKPYINKQNGYIYFGIKRKKIPLHRLLCINFKENPNNFPVVDHIDRNRLNNNLDNLRWCSYHTNSKNIQRKGCVFINKKYYKDKTYINYRYVYLLNDKRISKSFKTKEEAEDYQRYICESILAL